MTEFIDLIYCSKLYDGQDVLAYAPFGTYIGKGDIVCVDKMKGFFLVLCQVTVAKDSDTYKFITEALGTMYTVTEKYSHQEIGGSENE